MAPREGADLQQLELDIEEILSRKKVCNYLCVICSCELLRCECCTGISGL